MKATETITTTNEAAPGAWGDVPPLPEAVTAALAAMVDAVERRTAERMIFVRKEAMAEQEAKTARINVAEIGDVANDLRGLAGILWDIESASDDRQEELSVLGDLARDLGKRLKAAIGETEV